MTIDEADRELLTLKSAGVAFEFVAYYLPGRDPIPDAVRLELLPPGTWDAELAPMWPVLPSTDPSAAAVDAARDRWYADGRYASALKAAYFRGQEREAMEADRACDWSMGE